MGTLVEDAQQAAEWIAAALASSGYEADFTVESLREIDRFFEEHSCDGEPVPGGLLAEKTGLRLFALGSYVGEVVLRRCGGHWHADDGDPEGELNIEVVLAKGAVLWPVQRVMKRFKLGAEESIYHYGHFVEEQCR